MLHNTFLFLLLKDAYVFFFYFNHFLPQLMLYKYILVVSFLLILNLEVPIMTINGSQIYFFKKLTISNNFSKESKLLNTLIYLINNYY